VRSTASRAAGGKLIVRIAHERDQARDVSQDYGLELSAMRGCSGCPSVTGLKIAQRGPQPAPSAGVGFDTEALANAPTDSEFQLRVGSVMAKLVLS
jgi:hypothetical protein